MPLLLSDDDPESVVEDDKSAELVVAPETLAESEALVVVVPETLAELNALVVIDSEALVLACEVDTDMDTEAVASTEDEGSTLDSPVAVTDAVNDVCVGMAVVETEVLEAPTLSVSTPAGGPSSGS